MKHTIIMGGLIAWLSLFGCEITGAGIGLHDVEEGGECQDSEDCKRGTCYEERCKTAADGGECSEYTCDTDGDCCAGQCNGIYCITECADEYSTCDSHDDCCSGLSCGDGYCQ